MAATWLPFQKNLSCGLKLRGEEGVFHKGLGEVLTLSAAPPSRGLLQQQEPQAKTEQTHAVYK